MTPTDVTSSPDGLHGLLVRRGPELLVVLGLTLLIVGAILDRNWLSGFGLIAVMLGVVLPRVRGSLEAGPGGIKVAEIIDTEELRTRVRTTGKHLPQQAVDRAEDTAQTLLMETKTAIEQLSSGAARQTLTNFLASFISNAIADRAIAESAARREWRVTFEGFLSGQAIDVIDGADDVVIISRHSLPEGANSYSAIVNAVTGTEAVNRVRELLSDHGYFSRWSVGDEPVTPQSDFFKRPANNEDNDKPNIER